MLYYVKYKHLVTMSEDGLQPKIISLLVMERVMHAASQYAAGQCGKSEGFKELTLVQYLEPEDIM